MPETARPPRVFISYSHDSRKHQDRVLALADQLRDEGVDAIIDQYEQSPSQGWPNWCESEIENAEFVVVVCTEIYHRRARGETEPGTGHGALWEARVIKQELYDAASASNKFVPVLFADGSPDHIPRALKGASFHWIETPEGYEAVYRFLTDQPQVQKPELGRLRRLPSRQRRSFAEPAAIEEGSPGGASAQTGAGGPRAVSNAPIGRPRYFMGRDDELDEIHRKVGEQLGRVAITALHGLRGVGKTVLAAAYGEKHLAEYRAVWWVRAETEPGIRADLASLGVRLGWVGAESQEEPAVAIVLNRLREEGDGILLIFDNAVNVDAIRHYLPRDGRSRIIITSNSPAWRSVAEPVEITLWRLNIGADYLIARTGRTGERAAAEALSVALGGLPLAHEQAAAYCEHIEISLAEYHRRFDAAPVRLLDREGPIEYRDRLTVTKTFNLAIDEAARLNAAAEPLIVHAALLAPEPIPLFLFTEPREKFAEPLASAVADDGIDEVVAALRTFALVERLTLIDERNPTSRTDAIRLHRLVREVAAARGTIPHEQRMRAIVEALASVYPEKVFDDPGTWSRARWLDTPAFALITGNAEILPVAAIPFSELLNRLAEYRLRALGADAEARPLVARALGIREAALDPDDPRTARSLNVMGLVHYELGSFSEARVFYERSLRARERVLGSDHPDTAASLNDLGNLSNRQGDSTKARALHERALAIREHALGPEHADTAKSLINLAGALEGLGDVAGAQPLLERALAIQERMLGPEHPDTAVGVSNLGNVFRKQGNLAATQPLEERALAIREKVLGPEHPDTANSLSNLGLVLLRQNDRAAARPLLERALAIVEKTRGDQHPDTIKILANLATLRSAAGNMIGARLLLQRATKAAEKVFGTRHPETVSLRRQLSSLGARR